jgi:hypothetical protein
MKYLVIFVLAGLVLGVFMSFAPTRRVGQPRSGWPIPTARFPWGYKAIWEKGLRWEFDDEGFLTARDRQLGLVAVIDVNWVVANCAVWTGGGLLGYGVHQLWGAVRRRSPRYKPGRCRSCGYDLTGNVSGVCPECGGAVVPTGR